MRHRAKHRSEIPDLVKAAYEHAKREMSAAGLSLDGGCLEASVFMHDYFRRRGVKALLVRRELDEGDGHWTVKVLGKEFDPTIGHASWSLAMPVARNELHVVGRDSPHQEWRRTRVNTARAYEVAAVPYE